MEKTTFDAIISHPCSISLQEKTALQTALSQHPYSSLLHALDLLGDKACGFSQWREVSLPNAQRHLINMAHTEQMLAKVVPAAISAEEAVAKTQLEEEQKRQAAEAAEPFDVMKEINSYQEVSFKTAPKSVILSNFLENGAIEGLSTEDCPPVPIEVLGKKSISQDDDLDTETLAVILEKQGKYTKAIEVYQKLLSKYPEKSSTFAARIECLQTKLENNKK